MVHAAPAGVPGPLVNLEGDLDVRVDLDGGEVVSAACSARPFPGLDRLLRGRPAHAALELVPRVLSICAAAHRTCAAAALAAAGGEAPPARAIDALNTGQLVEALRHLCMFHYGVFLANCLHPRYRGVRHFADAAERWTPHTGTRCALAFGAAAGLAAVWGHDGTPFAAGGAQPGASTPRDPGAARAALERFRREWLEPVWLGCALEHYEQLATYDDFVAWLEENPAQAHSDLALYWRFGIEAGLHRYGGAGARYLSRGWLPLAEPDLHAAPGRVARLHVASGLYDAAACELRPAPTEPAPSYAAADRGPVEVGALARALIAGAAARRPWQHHDPLVLDMYHRLGGASVLLRHFARMHEMKLIYRQLERCIGDQRAHARSVEPEGRCMPQSPAAPLPEEHRIGMGATEASRGSLAHTLEIEGGRIVSYRIVSPTLWNAAAPQGERSALAAALHSTRVADAGDPVELRHVVASFDSCLACTLRVHDAASGAECARSGPERWMAA